MKTIETRLDDLEKSIQPGVAIGVYYIGAEHNPDGLVDVVGAERMTLKAFRAIPGSVLLRVIHEEGAIPNDEKGEKNT